MLTVDDTLANVVGTRCPEVAVCGPGSYNMSVPSVSDKNSSNGHKWTATRISGAIFGFVGADSGVAIFATAQVEAHTNACNHVHS